MTTHLSSPVRRLLRELFATATDVVLPAECPICGGPAVEGPCSACRATILRRGEPSCPRCGEPVVAAGAPCRAGHGWLAGIAFARAPLRYRGGGGALVRRFKFDSDAASRLWLARAMSDAIRGWADSAGRRSVFVSVPMTGRKRRQRGFDHAAELAEAVARKLGRGFVPRALARTVDTLPQGDPRVLSRERNVADAFVVRRPAPLRGRQIVLVDDVATSGCTARECARVLRAAGVRAVVLLTACRGRVDAATGRDA